MRAPLRPTISARSVAESARPLQRRKRSGTTHPSAELVHPDYPWQRADLLFQYDAFCDPDASLAYRAQFVVLVRCTSVVVVLVRGVNRVRTTPERVVTRVPARADVPGRTDDVTTRLVETDPPPPPPPPRATAGRLSSKSRPTARPATPSMIERDIVPSLNADAPGLSQPKQFRPTRARRKVRAGSFRLRHSRSGCTLKLG